MNIIERLRDAEAAINEDGWELEVDHFCDDDNRELDGWYAMRYNEKWGVVEPIGGVNDFVIALDEELRRDGIDIYEILNNYGCAYCG